MKRVLMWTMVMGGMISGLLTDGCSPPVRVTTLSHPGLSGAKLEKIGVMPFMKGRHPSNVSETLNCNLCRLAFDPESVVTGAEKTLTRYVYGEMRNRYEDLVIPQEQVIRVYEGISTDEERDTPLTVTRKVGQALGANLMLLGTVWRYRDRTGSSAGSMHPASVAFDLYLVDVRKGDTLWSANFDETQRSLSENIFDYQTFFSRGGKWLSANELANFGVKEVLKELPF